MRRQTHCQVCLSGNGEVRNATTDCMLRLDLENSLNFQLLVTVSSLAICSPCCSLIEMWSVFAARARTNLAAVSQNSSQLAGNAGTRLKFETQDLSRLLKQVLQSTDGPRTCLNTRAESSRCASSDLGRHNDCSESTLVHPNIKACSVVLNENEVEKYLERHQSTRASSQHKPAQDLNASMLSTVNYNSQESYCPLEMKIEIGSNPPSPDNTSFGACSAPWSPGAASLGSSSDNEEPGDISQDGFDMEVSSAQCSLLDTSSGHAKVSVRRYSVNEISSSREGDELDDREYSKRKMQNRFSLRSASQSIAKSTIYDSNNFSDQKPQMVLSDESSNMLDSYHTFSTDLPQDFEKADRENSLTCTVCKTTFRHSRSLKRHLKSNLHKNNVKVSEVSGKQNTLLSNFFCEICNAGFIKKTDLKLHIKRHLKQNKMILRSCSFCSKQFSTRKGLTEHICTHLSEGKSLCYSCKNIFSSEVELEGHVTGLNCKNLKTWRCNYCDKKLCSKQSYESHVTKIHNVDLIRCITTRKSVGKLNGSKKQFKCKICGKIISRKCRLKQHLLQIHQLEPEKVPCNIEVHYVMEPEKEQRLAPKHCRQNKLQYKICKQTFSKTLNVHRHMRNTYKGGDYKIENVEVSQKSRPPCIKTQPNEIMLKSCDFCSKQFSTRKGLTGHIFTHLLDRKSFCYSCKEIFSSEVDFKVHVTSLNCKNLNTWRCNYCGQKLCSERSYKTHMTNIHNVDLIKCIKTRKSVGKLNYSREQFKCKICGKIISRKCRLKQHLLQIHQLEPEKVPCNIEVSYVMKPKIKQKLAKKHSGNFICKICDKGFATASETLQHLVGIHKIAPNPTQKFISHQCKICNSTFSDNSNFYRHMRTIHKSRKSEMGNAMSQKLRLTCNECSLPCRNMYRLRLHMLKVHNVEAPRLNCTKCDSSFLHRRNLEKHLKVSHATGDFMCEICGTSFTNFFKLKNHIKHHQSAHFACQVCIESFENQSSLKFHVFWTHVFPTLPHTAWEYWKPDVLLLECDFCDATFTSELQLETHTLKHLSKNSSKKGEDVIENSIDAEMCELLDVNGPLRKFFPCFACNEEFAQFSALRLHITTHHKDAQHMQCKLCDKLCGNKSSYVEHMHKRHTLNAGFKLQCPYCFNVLKNLEHFTRHFARSLPPELNLADCCVSSETQQKSKTSPPFNCEFCENVYSSAVGKWKHVRDYHPEEWKHKCKFCGKKFILLCKAMKHERSFHKEKCVCPYCKISFAKQADLKQHVQAVHDGKPAFLCEKCNLDFPTFISLQSHRSKHSLFEFISHQAQISNETAETVNNISISSQENGNICPTCNHHFPRIHQLQIHIFTFHQKIHCYSCIECGFVSSMMSTLEDHMQNLHSKDATQNTNREVRKRKIGVRPVKASGKIYDCKKCGKQQCSLHNHIKHVSTCRPDVYCQGCNKPSGYFKRRRINMSKHEARCKYIVHPHKCDKCPLKFVHKMYLQRHKLKHELCWADRMSCPHCPLSFTSIAEVMEHYTKHHMNLLPFPLFCKLCDFNCDNKVELKLHATQHNQQMVHCNQCHRDVSVARFQRCHILTCKSSICSMCSMECGSTANLFLHMQQDHETAGEKHSCLLCLNSFPSESNLQQHVIHNHGQASFKCDICKVNISYKRNLRSHIKLHIQSKTRCRICGREFRLPSSLLQHTLIEHKDAIPPKILETLSHK